MYEKFENQLIPMTQGGLTLWQNETNLHLALINSQVPKNEVIISVRNNIAFLLSLNAAKVTFKKKLEVR